MREGFKEKCFAVVSVFPPNRAQKGQSSVPRSAKINRRNTSKLWNEEIGKEIYGSELEETFDEKRTAVGLIACTEYSSYEKKVSSKCMKSGAVPFTQNYQ